MPRFSFHYLWARLRLPTGIHNAPEMGPLDEWMSNIWMGIPWLRIWVYFGWDNYKASKYLGCQFAPTELVQCISTHHLRGSLLVSCFRLLVNFFVCFWLVDGFVFSFLMFCWTRPWTALRAGGPRWDRRSNTVWVGTFWDCQRAWLNNVTSLTRGVEWPFRCLDVSPHRCQPIWKGHQEQVYQV